MASGSRQNVLSLVVYIILLAASYIGGEKTLNDDGALNYVHPSSVSSEFTSYDVTLLDVFTTNGQQLSDTQTARGHYYSIVVQLTAFNKSFTLDLQLSRFMFAASYVEKSISNSREVYHAFNQKEQHCYYTGVVRNEWQTTAAVSTCRGVVGYFVSGDETYYIQPQQRNITGLHSVYRDSDSTLPPMRCGNDDIADLRLHLSSFRPLREIRSMRQPQDTDGKTKVVELYVVNDLSQYLFHGADTSEVTTRTKEIVNVVNSVYHPLGIYVVLVGVEVWSDQDKIAIEPGNPSAVLDRFLAYRRTAINPKHPNDNAQLITHVEFDDHFLGKATVGTMCTYRRSGGINSDVSSHSGRAGATMAHEMGHNFGLVHDTEVTPCPCDDPSGNCIMHPTQGGMKQARKWSECSKEQLKDSLAHGLDYCLYNLPDSYKSAFCGNGILDDGEECDCGQAPSSECNAACCNATVCKLIEQATCSAGRCCDIERCQLKAQAAECRPAADDCDLPEYCDGENPFCSTDVYKRDGTNCSINSVSAHCYQGMCRSLESQCQLLWGSSSKVSVRSCFENFNVAGQSSGNCGLDWETSKYTPCAGSDVMCGQLHCTPARQLASFKPTQQFMFFNSYITIGETQYYCNSTIIDVGMQRQDPGMAPNGAKCGDGKMCMDHKCADINNLPVPSCPKDCSSHGVCNTIGECHCYNGYGPPDCSSSGCGGSYHSRSPESGCINERGKGSNSGLTAGLCVFFLVILPLVVLTVYCGYRHRERLLPFLRTTIAKAVPGRRSDNETEASGSSAGPKRPSKPVVYTSNVDDYDDDGGDFVRPSRTAPVRPPQPSTPARPPQPAAYVIDVPEHHRYEGPSPSRAAPAAPSGKPRTAGAAGGVQPATRQLPKLPPRPSINLPWFTKSSSKPPLPPKPV